MGPESAMPERVTPCVLERGASTAALRRAAERPCCALKRQRSVQLCTAESERPFCALAAPLFPEQSL
jgi:hypothetical protein